MLKVKELLPLIKAEQIEVQIEDPEQALFAEKTVNRIDIPSMFSDLILDWEVLAIACSVPKGAEEAHTAVPMLRLTIKR